MNFGTKTSVGISVADHAIEAIELTGGIKPSIRARSRIALDEGTVVKGTIRDEKKLAVAFTKLFADASPSPITKRNIVFGVPETAIYFHIFEAQKISFENIAREPSRNIPLPPEDIAWGHCVSTLTKGVSRVVITATSRALIESWQKFLSARGISVDIFDIEVFAIFRNIFHEFPKKPVLLVDIGGRTTVISIFDSAGLAYTRSSHIAGEYLTREIAAALKVTRDEAEASKVAVGLENREHPLFFPLIKGLGAIMMEIRAAQEHFARSNNLRISEIVLVGGSSHMLGIGQYMEANLGLPIKPVPKSSDVEAVGYALRGLEDRWNATDPQILLDRAQKRESHWSAPDKQKSWWHIFTK